MKSYGFHKKEFLYGFAKMAIRYVIINDNWLNVIEIKEFYKWIKKMKGYSWLTLPDVMLAFFQMDRCVYERWYFSVDIKNELVSLE